MSETDLERRVEAVERAITDGETDLDEIEDAAAMAADLEALADRVETLEETVADLESAVQAVRGYAGNVRAVNREVERRASAALAKAETVETALESGGEDRPGRSTGGPEPPSAGASSGRTRGTRQRPDGRGPPSGSGDAEGSRDGAGDPGDPRNAFLDGDPTGKASGVSGDSRELLGGKDSRDAAGDAPRSRDGRVGGPGERHDRTDGRFRRSRRASRSDRTDADADPEPGRPAEDTSEQTAAFIERVRDAL